MARWAPSTTVFTGEDSASTPGLHQAKFAQLTAQRFRHRVGTFDDFVEVARRILGREIAPTLKGAVRARLDQNRLAVEGDATPSYAVLVDERTDGADGFAAGDLAFDDPETRAGVDGFIGPVRAP